MMYDVDKVVAFESIKKCLDLHIGSKHPVKIGEDLKSLIGIAA